MDNISSRGMYEELYISLKNIIRETERRILIDDPDELFMHNVNFFIKAYLISICTYLESYLQDIAFTYSYNVSLRLRNAIIPNNFIKWKLMKDVKDRELKYEKIDLSISKEEISENLSANIFRTIKMFKYLGVDLTQEIEFENNKAIVSTVVTKRNNIVHHNDEATDVSFSDLLSYIDIFIIYMKAIEDAVFNSNGFLQQEQN